MSSGLQRTIEELRATIEAQERTIEVLSDEVERRQASVTASAFTIWSQNLALESIVEKKTENEQQATDGNCIRTRQHRYLRNSEPGSNSEPTGVLYDGGVGGPCQILRVLRKFLGY